MIKVKNKNKIKRMLNIITNKSVILDIITNTKEKLLDIFFIRNDNHWKDINIDDYIMKVSKWDVIVTSIIIDLEVISSNKEIKKYLGYINNLNNNDLYNIYSSNCNWDINQLKLFFDTKLQNLT